MDSRTGWITRKLKWTTINGWSDASHNKLNHFLSMNNPYYISLFSHQLTMITERVGKTFVKNGRNESTVKNYTRISDSRESDCRESSLLSSAILFRLNHLFGRCTLTTGIFHVGKKNYHVDKTIGGVNTKNDEMIQSR